MKPSRIILPTATAVAIALTLSYLSNTPQPDERTASSDTLSDHSTSEKTADVATEKPLSESTPLVLAPQSSPTPTTQTDKQSLIERLTAGDQELLDKYEFDARTLAFAQIDLEALKAEMPDNLYWEMGAPTQDEAVKAMRKEKRDHWRQQANKISANQASEEEIRDYYEHQNTLSEDYVAFTAEVIKRNGHELPDTDYQMLTLAAKMHLNRLQEIPAQLARSLDQRQQFQDRKAEWLADKDAYEAKLRAEREAALKALGS